MKNLFLFIFLILLPSGIQAQNYTRAIVSDVHFFRTDNVDYNIIEGFPAYFHHQEFIDDVLIAIQEAITLRFKVDSVLFQSPDKIHTSEASFAPNLSAKEYAVTHPGKSNICVEVLTKIVVRGVNNGVIRYGFITKVKAYNEKGKGVYKFTYVVPFETMVGEEITGPVQLGEQDFYAFYLDGIKKAFEGKEKKSDLHWVEKPVTTYYDEYVAASEQFIYQPVKKGFAYGPSVAELKDVITFKGSFWHSMDDEYNFDNVFNKANFKEGYKLSNHFNKQEYLVRVKGDVNTFFDFLSLQSTIRTEFCDSEKNMMGEFELDFGDTLHGNLDGNEYMVAFNPFYNCSEFYASNKMIALMHHVGVHDVVYVHSNTSEEQLGDLFNIFFAWQFSYELQNAILEEENSADDM